MTALAPDPSTTPGYRPVASTQPSTTALLPRSVTLTVEVVPAPPWLGDMVDRINDLLALPADWDTYGAPPIEPAHIIDAIRLMTRIISPDGFAPWIAPTVNRGIQLEWQHGDVDVEARVDDAGAHLYVGDDDGEDEGDPTRRPDLTARAARALGDAIIAA